MPVEGQNHTDHLNDIDILHYSFQIDLNDSTDVIQGIADVVVRFKQEVPCFQLELDDVDSQGRGMKIDRVTENQNLVEFNHLEDTITIPALGVKQGSEKRYRIDYHGIPADGLIISKNKFGDRTFFGDNWPNRTHHWLPVVDHPSDKATVEFLVEAPLQYGIVANGSLVSESRQNGRVCAHWSCTSPLSTRLMVIGVSPFAVEYLTSHSGIAVSSWVYPQNRIEGFSDYRIALGPLDFFESLIAPYPFSKLANIQSRTRYGGMENASCIFYHERSVTGKQDQETLLAHEIAHQWFGDALTEMDWHHVWLSEGFATYLTDLYIEQKHGHQAFISSLEEEREQVLEFSRIRLAPVVDTTLPISVRLLNPNSYEKAGWVLHMLRKEVGDELFQECIRAFYEKFKYKNAVTADFRAVVDSVTGADYGPFFLQWFHIPGHPVVSSQWTFNGNEILLVIRQHQLHYSFSFPLDVRFDLEDGTSIQRKLMISSAEQHFRIPCSFKPEILTLDPDTWLMFEQYPQH
jgi:aminopeptidase N